MWRNLCIKMDYYFKSEKDTRLFIEKLKEELLNDLPGVDAHVRLAPEMRINELKIGKPPDHALESAVLILIYRFKDRLNTVVILRNEYEGMHSGQISLPGGKVESTDIDLLHTALREAQEEIGIDPDQMEILGPLSRFYVIPSNFMIYPFVAFLPYRPEFYPDPKEVQRVIEIDIFDEIDLTKTTIKTLTFRNNLQINAPGFAVGNEFMWGATAMIFSELLHVLNQVTEKLNLNDCS